MTRQINDARLWDGKTEVYIKGYAFAPVSVGSIVLPANICRDEDRRLITGVDVNGIRYLLYHSTDGFRHIKLEEVKLNQYQNNALSVWFYLATGLVLLVLLYIKISLE